jgi:hypothetical protein
MSEHALGPNYRVSLSEKKGLKRADYFNLYQVPFPVLLQSFSSPFQVLFKSFSSPFQVHVFNRYGQNIPGIHNPTYYPQLRRSALSCCKCFSFYAAKGTAFPRN